MTLVASTIPNLVSGVSQQPSPSRLRTSGEKMENAFPSIVSGLMKRPPSEQIAVLSSTITVSDSAAVHMIDRDATEKYILVAGNGDLELYDQLGVKQTVTFPDGKTYLPATDPWRKLRFVTVADTTFIMNNDVVVTSSLTTDTRPNPSLRASVFIKRAVPSTNFAIYVDGVLAATFATSDNTTAATALEGTSDIASELKTSLIANGYTDAIAVGTVVTFGITAGEKVTVLDQFGGAAMQPYTNTLQEFEDLPPTEVEGRLVKIQGAIEDLGESYWVVFEDDVWKETVGYNSKRKLTDATLPHILKKTAPNTFEFRRNTYLERIVGDDDSNPDPSFVGSKLNGMFLFKGRLGLLSEENAVLSEVTFFENFYRTTTIQLLSSDPIDVASVTGRVSTLYHAVSFSDELILFSDKQQFRLSSGTTLNAETVGITNSTAYPCSPLVAPVAVGSSAYFIADGATHSIAREIFIDESRETVNGEDIAVQVPAYIPKSIRSLSASPAADVFVVLSEQSPNELYVYKWYTTERKKLQSAWSKWVFDADVKIIGTGFLDDYLYLVMKMGADIIVDRILVGPVIDKDLLLDHQMDQTDVSSVFDDPPGEYTVTIPFPYPGTMQFIDTTPEGAMAPVEGVTKFSDTEYKMPLLPATYVVGAPYEFVYQFSNQYLREENAAGESAIQDGRLQLMYMSVIYTDTSYFEAHVTPTGGATRTTVYNGRTLADPDNIVDTIPRDTGEFKFPVFSQNEEVVIELRSNQPYRCAIGAVEWSANYKPKAKRVK